MNRSEKENSIKELQQHFNKSKSSFVVNYKGLSVNELQLLRKQLRTCGAKMKVAKDRLIKIAIKETPAKDLDSLLKEQLAIIFTDDSSAVAKIVYDFSKESSLNIVAGIVDANFYDQEKIQKLASLPSREILLAQLCGVLKASISNLARAISMVAEQKQTTEKQSDKIEAVAESPVEAKVQNIEEENKDKSEASEEVSESKE
ncbi:50S ribosomal protein L10 [candidate division TM6 bacterium RIFCSPHIGHO2_12_FULL_32_22]|nr:MAG: 50S ribosomal protein L10 [candidate division TM6 bacterium RIFCSPHIGHO2_12_FULL_32_22]